MSPSPGPSLSPPPPDGYSVLSGFEQSIMKAVSLTVFPPGGEIDPSGEDVGVSRFIDQYLSEIPRGMSIGLRAFLVIFDFFPLFMIIKFRRFSRMGAADRERYMEAWQNSRHFLFRSAFLALKSLCSLFYFTDARVREAMKFYVVCVDGKRREDI